MRPDRTAPDSDLSTVPSEFRENYRFLRELINCKEQNNAIRKDLDALIEDPSISLRGKLNRRQMKIIKDFIRASRAENGEGFDPPVPPELEASIRTKQRSTWLPWEAEAIHKIELWRDDAVGIRRRLMAPMSFRKGKNSGGGLSAQSSLARQPK